MTALASVLGLVPMAIGVGPWIGSEHPSGPCGDWRSITVHGPYALCRSSALQSRAGKARLQAVIPRGHWRGNYGSPTEALGMTILIVALLFEFYRRGGNAGPFA